MEEKIVRHQRGKDLMHKTWHASSEHLFMYIHSGSGSLVCREDIFPIKKGTLVFIAADTYHYTMSDVPEAYDRSKLTVSPERFHKLATLLGENSVLKSISGKAVVYAEIAEADREAVSGIFSDWNENEDSRELILLSGLLKLMYFLNRYTVNSTAAVANSMNCAIKYINENIAMDMDIGDICSAVNMSKFYFCRQFKAYTGLTVMKYILKTRIVLAKSELKKTGLSITEVSEKYGFSSVSYFCRVFKEEETCSPLQYRKRNGDL